ncbi:unnamed protein product [Amaranthus hypochondriacus]
MLLPEMFMESWRDQSFMPEMLRWWWMENSLTVTWMTGEKKTYQQQCQIMGSATWMNKNYPIKVLEMEDPLKEEAKNGLMATSCT